MSVSRGGSFPSESWHQDLVHSAADYAIISMDLHGVVFDWNPGATRLFQYPAAEMQGRSGDIIFTPEDRRDGAPERERTAAFKNGSSLDERWHVRKDGTSFWASGRLICVHDADGATRGLAKIVQDRTQEKATQDALRRSEERYRQVSRATRERIERQKADLEARVSQRTQDLSAALNHLEEFSYSMSHDLKGPAHTMRGLLDVLRDEQLSPEESADLIQRIHRNAVTLCVIIDEMVNFSAIGLAIPKLEPVDLDALVNQIIADLQTQEPGVTRHIHVNSPLGDAISDAILLRHAIRNLVSNALKFVAPGVPPQVTVFTDRQGERIRFHVKDAGIGIEPRFHGQIFELFRRLHHPRTYPGYGAGLATVKRATEKIGGTVTFQSEVGRGTTFTLELPAAPEA